MRNTIGVALSLVLAGVLIAGLGVGSASAAAVAREPGRTGLCTFETHNYATPGFSITPTHGVERAEGSISCRGTVSGKSVRETPGKIRLHLYNGTGDVSRARGGDDCIAFSTRHATIEVTLPSDEGTITVHGTFNATGAGVVAEIHGRLGSSSFSGLLQFWLDPRHLDENCVTKPLQHFITRGELALNG